MSGYIGHYRGPTTEQLTATLQSMGNVVIKSYNIVMSDGRTLVYTKTGDDLLPDEQTTDKQTNECRKQKDKALLARKSLMEIAYRLNALDMIDRTGFGTTCIAAAIYNLVGDLDKALDDLERFTQEAK